MAFRLTVMMHIAIYFRNSFDFASAYSTPSMMLQDNEAKARAHVSVA